MRALACSTLALLTLLSVSAQATAEPPAPMDDRVKILEVEMRRGPAQDLAPFLTPDAHKLSRVYAMRALRRLGVLAGDGGAAIPEVTTRRAASHEWEDGQDARPQESTPHCEVWIRSRLRAA